MNSSVFRYSCFCGRLTPRNFSVPDALSLYEATVDPGGAPLPVLTTNANFWFGETSDQQGSAPNAGFVSIGARLPLLVTEYVAVLPSPVRVETCDITSWLALSKTKP